MVVTDSISSSAGTVCNVKKLKSENASNSAQKDPVLQVKKLSENARLPERGSSFAAGYDLFRYAIK